MDQQNDTIDPKLLQAFQAGYSAAGGNPGIGTKEQFEQSLRSHLGMGIEDILEMRKAVLEIRREQDMMQLRQAWGDEFEAKQARVVEALKGMPPAQATLYNNVQGAMALSNYLDTNPVVPGSEPPKADTGVGTQATTPDSKFLMKGSEYYAMGTEEKASRWAEIQSAAESGQIDWDN